MTKKQSLLIIFCSVILAWVFNVFPGKFLLAKISTWPALNRLKLISPQAPIVITNRETVHVSDSGDVQSAVSQMKPKIGAIFGLDAVGGTAFLGTAVALTPDGVFVAPSYVFGQKPYASYAVVLNDGRQAQISQRTQDPAEGLTYFITSLSSVPIASLARSEDLAVGDKLVLLQASLKQFSVQAYMGMVTAVQNDSFGKILDSDVPSRSFAVAFTWPSGGGVIADTGGNLAGIWTGSKIISSDVLKQSINLFFNNRNKIVRPTFGFGYVVVSSAEAGLQSSYVGIKLTQLSGAGPAQKAQLQVGDIITSIGGQSINEDNPAEEILERAKAGDKLEFSIMRKGQNLKINLLVG